MQDLHENEQDGLAPGPRAFATVVIAIGTFMAILDGTIANVALPTFVHVLRISPAESIWIVNAFSLVLVGTVLPLAAAGDNIGYTRIYQAGLVVFTIGSLACALAPAFPYLVAARIIQGFGAAGIMSIGPALYRTIFPKALLGRGVGISALVVACSAAAGPSIGGLMLHFVSWPWLFAINVPLGIMNFFLAKRALPRMPGRAVRLDGTSVAMSFTGLPLTLLGIDLFTRHQAGAVSLIASVVGIAIIAGFVQRQCKIATPLVPPGLFAVRRFSLAALTSCISFTAQGLAFVSLPFFFSEILHTDVLHTGFYLSAWPLAIACTAPISGRLSDKYPPPILSTIGLLILAIGLGLLATVHQDASPLELILRNVVCGIGFGFFQPPNNRELLGNAPRQYTGSASGVLSMMRVLGQTVGAAGAAIVLSSTTQNMNAAHLEAGLRLSLCRSCDGFVHRGSFESDAPPTFPREMDLYISINSLHVTRSTCKQFPDTP